MKSDTIAIIPVRLDSARLPGKALLEIEGHPVIYYLVERLRSIEPLEEVVIATSDRSCDTPIVDWADANRVASYRGAVEDVLGRFMAVSYHYQAKLIVRANGDSPLLAPEVIRIGLQQVLENSLEFVTGKSKYTNLPVGIGAEIITAKALERCHHEARGTYYREHVTTFIFDHPDRFLWAPIPVETKWAAPEINLTLDTPEDLETIRQTVKYLRNSPPASWTIEEMISSYKNAMKGLVR